jgi:hypothetical protein
MMPRFWLIALLAASPQLIFAQAEVIPPRHAVVSFVYTRSDTGRRFDFLGGRDRVIPPAGPLFTGRAITDVLSLDIAYGILPRLDAHVNIPYAFSSTPSIESNGSRIPNGQQSPSSSGVSNLRFGARYNLVRRPLFVTARIDIKAPASTPNLEELFNGVTLPIREGQTDIDLSGQVSKSLRIGEHAFSVGGELGYRIRTTQQKGALDTFTLAALPVKPGNEIIYNLRVAYPVAPRISLLLNGDGIEGNNFDVPFRFTRIGNDGLIRTVGTVAAPEGFTPDYAQQTGRRIFTLGPLLAIRLNRRTSVSGGVLFTVAGRNFPAGQFYVVGITRVIR